MTVRPYNRAAAAAYAKQWALGRNPRYYDFDPVGGDCTNFVSQCLFAGVGVMNFAPLYGWYYRSSYDRTPSWTGVDYLWTFLTRNEGYGPFGYETDRADVLVGDLIQLGTEEGRFYHSLLITRVNPQVLVCAHSDDALDRPLEDYRYGRSRFLHIEGVWV